MSKLLPFHQWVRTSRKGLNVTQVQLAEKMGCTQSSIVRIESGNHDPLLETIGRICKALGVNADMHIDSKGRPKMWTLDGDDATETPPKTGTDG